MFSSQQFSGFATYQLNTFRSFAHEQSHLVPKRTLFSEPGLIDYLQQMTRQQRTFLQLIPQQGAISSDELTDLCEDKLISITEMIDLLQLKDYKGRKLIVDNAYCGYELANFDLVQKLIRESQ
jgi:hypothetical protein